ncbi:hypothetical protein ENBRE01_2633 [Enteropsectra breve]|nr:hypothetical protein ENBRE01_2633 [Enteropsectra breve]
MHYGQCNLSQNRINKTFLQGQGVEYIFLPAYSPELNPIENVFSIVKAKLHQIRPRASAIPELMHNIEGILLWVGDLVEYYRYFWEMINSVLYREF